MSRPIITHFYQLGALAYAAIVAPSAGTLYLITTGGQERVRIIRFEWMTQLVYDALAAPALNTLYIIRPVLSDAGRGTAHRWPVVADTAVALYLGPTAVTAAHIGETQVFGV